MVLYENLYIWIFIPPVAWFKKPPSKFRVTICVIYYLSLYYLSILAFASRPSLGATRTKDARELLYARQKVVVTTKAFGLQAIDLVYIDYKDVEGLRLQAKEGALMGFTGNISASFSDCNHD